MNARTQLRRIVFSAYLVIGAALAVVMPIAEARAEAASVAAGSHVEEPGDRACPAAHDHVSCNVCRTLRLSTVREHSATLAVQGNRGCERPSDLVPSFVQRLREGHVQSRAPPAR
jgi:hypothetical protein